ncbi:sugar ABC transporter permease [Vibrio lamellibrachiae]|uniref:carbohydrate ABC transporter permease n=1 Tax=Vibrio lamellibrachiae TaxID=2910253 RepID=UPI003D0CEC81
MNVKYWVVPALAINFLMIVVPALFTVYISFTDWDGFGTPLWVGLENFEMLFTDESFLGVLWNNVVWTFLFITIPVIFGVFISALLMLVKKGKIIYQSIFLIPYLLASVINATIWRDMIYSPVSGVFSYINKVMFEGERVLQNPLSDPATSLFGVIVVDMWHWWGFVAIIFFAAMRQINQEQIEAAKVDGASFYQIVTRIIMPFIKPTILLILSLSVIWSFLAFDYVFVLTGGGPANSSELLATLSYKRAFQEFDVGGAAAISVVISFFGLISTAAYIFFQREEN